MTTNNISFVSCRYNILLIVFSHFVLSVLSLDCTKEKPANQMTDITAYWVSAISPGYSAVNVHDGNIMTGMTTEVGQPSDNGFHFVLLKQKSFAVVTSVTVNANQYSNYHQVYLSDTDPFIKPPHGPTDAKLDSATWTNFLNSALCRLSGLASKPPAPYNITVTCNSNSYKPTRYILITFKSPQTSAPYDTMQINEIFYSVLDINRPVSYEVPTANWVVTCSGNLATPSCSDYVICSSTSSSCWSDSYISLGEVGSADPRGPYYCRLKYLLNQRSYSGLTPALSVANYFENAAYIIDLSYTIDIYDNKVDYKFTCHSVSSLPNVSYNVIISDVYNYNASCHMETVSETVQTTNLYGGFKTETTKIVTLYINNTYLNPNIKLSPVCEVNYNGVTKHNHTSTVIFGNIVDGGWSAWTNGTCSATCGGGYQVNTRFCDNPMPVGLGKRCSGLSFLIEICNEDPCPVNGSWTSWSNWSPCSVTSVQTRNRWCTNPSPGHGGSNCTGDSQQSQTCVVPTTASPTLKPTLNSTFNSSSNVGNQPSVTGFPVHNIIIIVVVIVAVIGGGITAGFFYFRHKIHTPQNETTQNRSNNSQSYVSMEPNPYTNYDNGNYKNDNFRNSESVPEDENVYEVVEKVEDLLQDKSRQSYENMAFNPEEVYLET